MSENNDYSYLLDLIKLAESGEEKDENEKLNIRYEGEFFINNNTSRVNKSLSYVLLKDSSYNLSLSIKENNDNNPDLSKAENIINNKLIYDNLNKQLDKTDFTLRHEQTPNFRMPEKGKWVVFQNWDYGSVPLKWIESIADYVDELWVSSNYVKNSFIDAGIVDEKIKVINSGVDSLYFNYHVTPSNINTKKKKKFLFRGELNWKSGFDLLLKAYSEEFVKDEDICLVIMSDAKNVSLEYNNKIKAITDLPDNPEILLIDELNNESGLPALYKACDFLVYPYRAESYCLNLLESMACGTPAIVTNFGSANDYCNSDNSIPVNSTKIYQTAKNIENVDTIDYPYWAETDIIDLRLKLRHAFEYNEDEYNSLAQKASKSVLDKFTWVKINDLIKDNLLKLNINDIKRDKQQNLNQKILEGLNALTQGDFDKSLESLKEAYKIDPDNTNLNFYLANIMLAKEDYENALIHISKSLLKQPRNEDYNNLAGIIVYKLGNYILAKKIFEHTLDIMPEHSGAKESLQAIEALSKETFNSIGLIIDKDIINFFNSLSSEKKAKRNSTISVCILTRNEEKNIEKAIKSVKSIADEIVVLDTGSTDKTVEIVKSEGVKVFSTNWQEDFSKARNELISHATMDWILMLDADECLTDDSATRIKPLLANLESDSVYQLRITNFIDKNGLKEKQEHYVVRILPNHQNIIFQGPIHEYPVKSDGSLLNSENIKDIEILHYGYTEKAIKEKSKISRNRAILEKTLTNFPDAPLSNFYLAENYKDEQNYEKAIYFSDKVVNFATENKYKNILELAKLNILDSLINLDKKSELQTKLEEFRNDLSHRPDFWFLYASLEFNLGNFAKSIEYNKNALKLRSEKIYSALDLGTIGWKPLALISQAYKNLNDIDNALIYLKRAIKAFPENIDLYYQLAGLYSDLQEIDLMENTIRTFIGSLDNNNIANLLDRLKDIYFQKNSEDRLYRLLESVRLERLKGNFNIESKYLAEKLIELYERIIIKNYDVPAVKYSIACCYGFIGELDKAEEYFEDLMNMNNLEVDSLHNLASIALSKKDIEKAERLYKKVLEIDEFHSDTYLSLAKLELARNNIDKAKEYMLELSEIDPDNKDLSFIQFEIARSSGDKKLASDMYAAMLFRNKQ